MRKPKKKSRLQKSRENPNSRLWMHKADRAWKDIIHMGGRCMMCGSTEYLQAHHIFPREIKIYRHDPHNGVLLCSRCHKYNVELSAHRNAPSFFINFQMLYPERWKWVCANYKIDPATKNDYNYMETYKKLEELLKVLKRQHETGIISH